MESNHRNQKQQSDIFGMSSSMSSFPSSSETLADISNFKTPRNPSKRIHFTSALKGSPQSNYCTASKATPVSSTSSVRRPVKSSAARSKTARRLKAFEIEQSKSARKAQFEKEKSLKTLAKSLTVWLNFLFENPGSCGCDMSVLTGEFDRLGHGGGVEEHGGGLVNGKRGNGPGYGVKVGVEGPWRGPKRQRNSSWREGLGKGETASAFINSSYLALKASLNLVCSLDDLKERMKDYLSSESCKEIFDAMTHVTKNIDEGRLKMRAHCPMVTDVALRERSMKILLNYNQTWLRIGLYIILGGDSLLPQRDVNSEQEIAFLRVVIEKQIFSHPELAKDYAYNKLVDGLYRPGYYEKLGNAILKRFLLLVLILDRAKSQSSLPLKYGIDGLDGGSPLLFSSSSNIKSSSQLISEFLSSDVMHGEGNLLAHLMIVGYKVTYQQSPLVEYDFRVKDIFGDLEDGVRLCRAIQLLHHDSSILLKMVVPSDTRKKSLVNCGLALQYLKQAGVSLCDEDGMFITEEDIVNREKELTLSLMWNMFVHMQLPLLVSNTLLSEEICKIRGVVMEESSTCSVLDMLFGWIQAIAESYNLKIDNFSCLVDGKAMWCLLDYYFRKEHHCSFKDPEKTNKAVSLVSTNEYADAVHNFILSQKLTSLLGNFPEVLQVSDLLEHKGACNDRSVVILLVFLSFQLLVKRNKDQLNFHKLLGILCKTPEKVISNDYSWGLHFQEGLDVDVPPHASEDASTKFKAIMAWWQGMAQQNNKCDLLTSTQDPVSFLSTRRTTNNKKENAAKIIQSHFRQLMESHRVRMMKQVPVVPTPKENLFNTHTMAALTIQRVWKKFALYKVIQNQLAATKIQSHLCNKHNMAALTIQRVWKKFALYKVIQKQRLAATKIQSHLFNKHTMAALTIQRVWKKFALYKVIQKQRLAETKIQSHLFNKHTMAALTIQRGWKKFALYKVIQKQRLAATKIQSHLRRMVVEACFRGQKEATLTIQSIIQSLRSQREFQKIRRERISSILIQTWFRGWIKRKLFHKLRCQVLTIQRHVRGWLTRKELFLHKVATLRIQNAFRSMKQQRRFCHGKLAAVEIQRRGRAYITRKTPLGSSSSHDMLHTIIEKFELKIVSNSVLRLQRWWRSTLAVKERTRSASIIQSHVRGFLNRKELLHQKEAVLRIQNAFRSMKQRRVFCCQRLVAVEMQRFVRGYITRRRLLGGSSCRKLINENIENYELKVVLRSVLNLQRWWRSTLVAKQRTQSAIIIQSHFRGWSARQWVVGERHRITIIQAYWKGYLVRKDSRGQLLDLRLRMQQSAANVVDSMRLINRLIAALSELQSMRSVRGILHTCATLDFATKHSQRCCEELVAAGAISTLLKQMRSVSRSIPDQAVLKHALSTLRNLSRYPHLREVLIDTSTCVEIVLWEIIRNKEEGYFIACKLLKSICQNKKGIEVARKSLALLKRLHALVEDLSKKAANERRNKKPLVVKEQLERRLKAAVEVLELIKGT